MTGRNVSNIHTHLTTDPLDIPLISDFILTGIHRRDAAIVAIIDPAVTPDAVATLLERPSSEESRAIIATVTTRAMREPEILDTPRIRRIAHGIAAEAASRNSSSLHATAAYLSWMIRDDREAADHALTALALDEDSSLAAIVLTLIDRRIAR